MYISRRGDIVGPPVWKSTISPHLSKSKLVSLRPWQSEHQQHMLSPLHHHTLTLPGYPTTPSHTRNPSNVKHDKLPQYPPGTAISMQGMSKTRKKRKRMRKMKRMMRTKRMRSEERRVGKECRSRWSPYH